ncbi:MAG: hypothetical protein N2C14_09290 [Planctomycetales bacterium]
MSAKPLRIDDRAEPAKGMLASERREVAALRTLEQVVKRLHEMKNAAVIKTIARDEFSLDVIVAWERGLFLAFDVG